MRKNRIYLTDYSVDLTLLFHMLKGGNLCLKLEKKFKLEDF